MHERLRRTPDARPAPVVRPQPRTARRTVAAAAAGAVAAAPASVLTSAAPASGRVQRASDPATARSAGLVVQAKLTVGSSSDPLEREADEVAARVMRGLAPGAAPTPSADVRVRRRAQAPGIGASGGEVDGETESAIRHASGGGRPLEPKIRRSMETAIGADFSNVRIHDDAAADRASARIQATAFTTGRDIFFRNGAYDPSTTSGQELVAHELAHVVQQGGGAAPVLRRRIGFEIETGIPISERTLLPDGITERFDDIDPSTVGNDLQVTRGKLAPDHIPGTPVHAPTATENFTEWPIIELVTDPVADDLSMAAFEPIARNWITTIRQLKALAQTAPPAQQLLGDYYIGLPTAQPYGSWDRIAPQVTVGIPIDQVGKVLAAFDPSAGNYRQQLATQIGQRAPGIASRIMQDVYVTYPPDTDGKGQQAVKGLVTMIVNHLLIGGEPEIAKQVYAKNRSANVMYKTKLSTVRNNIVENTYAAKVLRSKAGRLLLRNLLIAATGRNGGDPAFLAHNGPHPTAPSTVTVTAWVREVLNGSDDQLFEEMRNPWSQELAPDATDEVVVEIRKVGAFVAHGKYDLDAPDGLLGFMKAVYGANQLYKQRTL